MDSKPLIAISFIDKNVKSHCSNTDLVGITQQDIRIFLRPQNYEELKQLITKEYSPKDKSPNSTLLYFGILPSGDRVTISDDLTFQKDISIIFACYQKNSMNSEISRLINPISYFSKDNIKPQIKEDDIPILKIDDEIYHRMKSMKMPEHILKHKNLIEDYIKKPKEPFENIKKNITELCLSSSKENIKKSLSNLDEIKGRLKDFGSKSCKYLNILKNNNKKLGEMSRTMRNIKMTGDINPGTNKHSNVLSEHPKEPKPKPEEEKVIFKFKKESIEVEKDLNEIIGKEVKIEKIQVKNISKKEYNSNLMSWSKENNSDENINIIPGKVNPQDKVYFSNQDISDFHINITIKDPKENANYKILASLINKESKKIISEKPLTIVVKIKEKVLNKEEIKNIMNNLKREYDLLELILKSDEIKKIINEQKGDINKIKNLIGEKYANEKEKKIIELMEKLQKETNYQDFLRDDDVEAKIPEYKFDEKAIKEWIQSRNDKPPKPIIDEKRIREIYDKIDGEYYISGVIDFEEFKKEAIKLNYDEDKLRDWATTQL